MSDFLLKKFVNNQSLNKQIYEVLIMANCNNCGAEAPESTGFCPKCGSEITSGTNRTTDLRKNYEIRQRGWKNYRHPSTSC